MKEREKSKRNTERNPLLPRWLSRLIITALFVCLFAVSLALIDKLLCDKSGHGALQARALYDQPEGTVDVAFMGSSHVHCNVNTALLWDEFGIAAYDYSAAEQPLWISYYYLKELLKHQDPMLVVLDVFSPANAKEDYQYHWLSDNLDGVRFSPNKVRMLMDSCEPSHYLEYFPSFAVYHDRYRDLTKDDIEYFFSDRHERARFKGFTPYFGVTPLEEVGEDTFHEEVGGLTAKSEEYLIKIMDLCKAEGIDLYIIVSPYVTVPWHEEVYNRIREIAEAHGVPFSSTNYNYDDMGLDFSTDLNDASHLNYLGSIKYTRFLADELEAMEHLPDRRGDPKWQSWEEHAREMEAYAAEVIETLPEFAEVWRAYQESQEGAAH